MIGCSVTGKWVETGSYTTYGKYKIGLNLSGAVVRPYCSHPVSAVVTVTGPSTFQVSDNWVGGSECQNAVSTMTFGPTCNTASGPYVNADGTSGVVYMVRRDPDKDLDPVCQDTSSGCCQPGMQCGDPINPTTGNVHETFTDFAGAPSSPLKFVRHYSSQNTASGSFGVAWSHDYAAKILVFTPTLVELVRGSGKGLTFELVNGQWVGDPDVTSRLTQQVDGSGQILGWLYTSGSNGVESYDANGRLVAMTSVSGALQTLAYDNTGLLLSVSDRFGRQLLFTYDSNQRLSTMTTPDGGTYIYGYDTLGNLVSVGQPGGTTQQYQYGNPTTFPHAMTAAYDENGKKFTSWSYDANGYGVTSQHAVGIDKTTIAYDVPALGSVTVTDALNRTQIFEYTNVNNSLRPLTFDLTGSGFPLKSSWTYFDNGNVGSYIDFLGNLSCYAYDQSRNLQTLRVEGLPYTADACNNLSTYPLSSNARVIATAWHPLWRLSTQVAVPKKRSTNVYNGQVDPVNGGAAINCVQNQAALPDGSPIAVLCKSIEQATTDAAGALGFAATIDSTTPTRTRSYTYNAYGQMLTETDPLAHTTTFAYYSSATADHRAGDLQSVTNAVGHVTQFTKYDGAGRVLRSVAPNGSTTDWTYSPRGWPTSISVAPSGGGVAQVSSFTYDLTGLLKTSTLPDGTTVQFAYDDAHRLISATDGAGNTVTYTLDDAGNRTGEQTKDPQGALTRSITRVFDGLNRLQSVTGAPQ